MNPPPAAAAPAGDTRTPGSRRRILLPIVAGVAVLVATLVGGKLLRAHSETASPWPPAPAGGPFLPWPTAGNAVNDRELVDRAVRAWDAADQNTGPHTDVHPLLIQTRTPTGPVVILQGNDSNNAARTAIITGTTNSADVNDLRLRADRPASAPATTRQISLVTSRFTAQTGAAPPAGSPVIAVVLAEPGTDSLRLSSSVTAAPYREKTASGRIAVTALDPRANAFTTTITGTRDTESWNVYADEDTVGEPQAHAVTSFTTHEPGYIGIRLPAAYAGTTLQPLVTNRHGVVGRVSDQQTNTDGTLNVELVTHPGFTTGVTTADGTIALARATATGLELVNGTHEPQPGETVLVTQSVGPAPQDQVFLPLAVAATEARTASPDANGQWQASTTALDVVTNASTTEPLYVIAPTSPPTR